VFFMRSEQRDEIQPEFLQTAAVAKMLGLSVATVLALARRGVLHPIKLSSQSTLFEVAQVRQAMAARRKVVADG
jgi:hypothetical protein